MDGSLFQNSLLVILRGPCSERWMRSVRGNTLFPTCMGNLIRVYKLEVTLTIEGTREGHVVQGSSWNPRPFVGGHSSDAVLSLLSWELPPQLLWSDVVLQERDIEGPQVLFPAPARQPLHARDRPCLLRGS